LSEAKHLWIRLLGTGISQRSFASLRMTTASLSVVV